MKSKELADHLEEFYILDVREPDELDTVIPGSKNVPLSVFAQAMELSEEDFLATFGFPRFTKQDKIVAVCHSGARSGHVSMILRKLGFDAQNLDGGMLSWEQ